MDLEIPWLHEHDATIRYRANTITFDYYECCRYHNAFGRPTWIKGLDFILEPPQPKRMAFINSEALLSLRRRKGKHGKPRHKIQSLTMQQINAALKMAGLCHSLRLAGLETKTKDPSQTKNPQVLVPGHFHDFLHVFEKGEARKLPPHRSYD